MPCEQIVWLSEAILSLLVQMRWPLLKVIIGTKVPLPRDMQAPP